MTPSSGETEVSVAKLSLVPTRPTEEPLAVWVRRVKRARMMVRIFAVVAFLVVFVIEVQNNWQTSPLYLFGLMLAAVVGAIGSDRLSSGIEQAEYEAEWGAYYASDGRARSNNEDV